MPNTTAEIVNETLTSINQQLKSAPRAPVNEAQDAANKIIGETLHGAFIKVPAQNRKKLYYQFALALHSDKLAKQQPEIYQHLVELNLQEEPMKILGAINNGTYVTSNIFNKVAADPAAGLKELLTTLYNKFSGMHAEYKRYYQPFRTLVNVFSWIINITLGAAVIVAVLYLAAVGLMLKLANWIQVGLVNLVTRGEYGENLEDEIFRETEKEENAFNLARKNYINNLKTGFTDNHIIGLDEEDFIDWYINLQMSQQNFEDVSDWQLDFIRLGLKAKLIGEIRATMHPDSFSKIDEFFKIKLMATTLFDIIARPLPDSISGKIVQIVVVKPLQVLSTPVLLAAAGAMQLASLTYIALLISVVVATAALKIVSLAVLNSPLYALDLVRYLGNLIQSAFENCQQSDHENAQGYNQEPGSEHNNPMRGLGSKPVKRESANAASDQSVPRHARTLFPPQAANNSAFTAIPAQECPAPK